MGGKATEYLPLCLNKDTWVPSGPSRGSLFKTQSVGSLEEMYPEATTGRLYSGFLHLGGRNRAFRECSSTCNHESSAPQLASVHYLRGVRTSRFRDCFTRKIGSTQDFGIQISNCPVNPPLPTPWRRL